MSSFWSSLGFPRGKCMISELTPSEAIPEIGSEYSGMIAWPSSDSNQTLTHEDSLALLRR
jgi:hypothetical protein